MRSIASRRSEFELCLQLATLNLSFPTCYFRCLQTFSDALLTILQHLEHGLIQESPQKQEQKNEVDDLRNQERSIDS